jgi:hypothetical protein
VFSHPAPKTRNCAMNLGGSATYNARPLAPARGLDSVAAAPICGAMSASRELQRQLKRFALYLLRPAKKPPARPGWIHEIKHDGFRILASATSAASPCAPAEVMTSPIASSSPRQRSQSCRCGPA